MALLRCADQDYKTLIESYQAYEDKSELFRTKGKDMIHLIERINVLFADVAVYAFTSHDSLCLVTDNQTQSNVHVVITAHGYGEGYMIQYVMPGEEAPWSFARVVGETKTLKEAVQMVLIAMHRSQGWQHKPGVMGLLQDKLGE